MVKVVELQTRATIAPDVWEPLIRFALVDNQVEIVAREDDATQSEVTALLDEIYDETLLKPEDGDRFFSVVGKWTDGTRFARMTSPAQMDIAAARTTAGLVSAETADDDNGDDEPTIELIGRLQSDFDAVRELAVQ